MNKTTIAAMRKSVASMPPSQVKELCGSTYRKFEGKRYTLTSVPRTCKQPGDNKQALKEHARGRCDQYRIVKTRDICPYRYILYTR